jgi:hypothetical protein
VFANCDWRILNLQSVSAETICLAASGQEYFIKPEIKVSVQGPGERKLQGRWEQFT